MFELFAGLQGGMFDEGARLLQVSLVAVVAGLLAEALVDTGTRARGMPLLCGLTGVWLGNWAARLADWSPAPHVADHALLPALLGTLTVAVFVKLVGLGIVGPQR